MNDTSLARRVAIKTLLAIVLGSLLIALCYIYIDRPVAFYVHDHHLSSNHLFLWLTYPPPILQAWAPLVLGSLMLVWMRGPLVRWARVLLALSVSIILADQFRESLSFVFGRYWPETWINNNPSLIKDGAYGFHFFHEGGAYGSFPSGHAARMVALAAVIWIAYPKWRWACVSASLAVCVGLLGMNYHFVSDVIAGSLVGGIVGAYTTVFCMIQADAPAQ